MRTLFLTIFLTLLFVNTAAATSNISHLRGQRYCEIFLGFKIEKMPAASVGFFGKEMKVYNTIGLNDCPATLWDKIDTQQIKKMTGATTVKLNGPRIWTIDGMKSSSLMGPKIISFNGLKMREAGILDLPLYFFLKSRPSYQPVTVQRHTTWIYQTGNKVFELISPINKVYIMQSYSLEKTRQTPASLVQLGMQLKLPKGWHFRARTLNKNYYLTPLNQKAVIVQDDFLNTYQEEVP